MANYDANALEVFNAVCRMLDSEDLKYTLDEDNLNVLLSARGDDLSINVLFRVDTERKVLSVHSLLDTVVPQDKMAEFAIAVNAANYPLVNGSFDLSITDGKITFRMAQPYFDDSVSDEIIKYIFYCLFSTVDEYNDRFLVLAKEMIDLKKFIELANS